MERSFDPLTHRKRVKHSIDAGRARLLTFSCYRQWALLADDGRKAIVGEAIERACTRHRFVLIAWVIMPEHVHVLGVPWEVSSGVSGLLKAIKRPSSYKIKQLLVEADPELARNLTIRERPGKMTFRFWQEGSGHDRTVRSDDGLFKAIEYLHLNPVERGLCQSATEWAWSSARQYRGEDGVRPRVVRWSWSGLEWEGPESWFGDA